MKPVPDYIQRAAVSLLAPFVGELEPEHIVRGIALAVQMSPAQSGERPVTLSALALTAGMTRQRLRRALRRAKIAPVGLGGRTGREELYSPSAVAGLLHMENQQKGEPK